MRPRTTPTIVAWMPGLVQGDPHRDPEHDVQRRVPDVERRNTITATASSGGDEQRVVVDAVGVEDRDHEDRADVVDDGEREEEQLQRRRDTRLPSRLSTPTANAMSVAIGMPQPSTASPPALIAR